MILEPRSWRTSEVRMRIMDSLLDMMAAIEGFAVGEKNVTEFVF